MGENKSAIENLPQEALREIMLRLAESHHGELDVVTSMLVCKSFHQHISEDQEVLRTVNFCGIVKSACDSVKWDESGSPDLDCQFQVFKAFGGFIYRAARAGNPKAELILAELIIRSTSVLIKKENEAWYSSQPCLNEENKEQRRCARAVIAHFTNSSSTKVVHYELVRKLLNRADIDQLRALRIYLQDYASYFLNPSIKEHHKKFTKLLNDLEKLQARTQLHKTAQLFITEYNSLCITGGKTMRKLGVKIFPKARQLKLLSMGEESYYFRPHNFVQCYEMLRQLLVRAYVQARDSGNDYHIRLVSIMRLLIKSGKVKDHLMKYVEVGDAMVNIQNGLKTKFEDMFPKLVV